jgi:uncharacterized membrane protein YfhO
VGASPAGARVTSYAPGRVSLELTEPASAGSALLVSENYYPGWRATVDGKEVPVGRANITLIGVPLTQGARKVELAFDSPTYERGKLITLLALGMTLVMITAGIITERKAIA